MQGASNTGGDGFATNWDSSEPLYGFSTWYTRMGETSMKKMKWNIISQYSKLISIEHPGKNDSINYHQVAWHVEDLEYLIRSIFSI